MDNFVAADLASKLNFKLEQTQYDVLYLWYSLGPRIDPWGTLPIGFDTMQNHVFLLGHPLKRDGCIGRYKFPLIICTVFLNTYMHNQIVLVF